MMIKWCLHVPTQSFLWSFNILSYISVVLMITKINQPRSFFTELVLAPAPACPPWTREAEPRGIRGNIGGSLVGDGPSRFFKGLHSSLKRMVSWESNWLVNVLIEHHPTKKGIFHLQQIFGLVMWNKSPKRDINPNPWTGTRGVSSPIKGLQRRDAEWVEILSHRNR